MCVESVLLKVVSSVVNVDVNVDFRATYDRSYLNYIQIDYFRFIFSSLVESNKQKKLLKTQILHLGFLESLFRQ